MSKKRSHGWVFEIKGNPRVYAENWGPVETRRLGTDLRTAARVRTRELGRVVKHNDEVLRKVEINENHVSVKILPGR